MWVDEGAFMEEALFLNVIVPIMEMMNCVLIITSTLVSMYNYLTELMHLKDPDTGLPIFNVYQQSFICDRCQRGDRPQDCRHRLYEIPPHKSATKKKLISHIYGEKNAMLMARESMGVLIDAKNYSLDPRDIEAVENKDLFDWETTMESPPTHVFIGCDPNAMGRNKTAYVAMAMVGGAPVVRELHYIYI